MVAPASASKVLEHRSWFGRLTMRGKLAIKGDAASQHIIPPDRLRPRRQKQPAGHLRLGAIGDMHKHAAGLDDLAPVLHRGNQRQQGFGPGQGGRLKVNSDDLHAHKQRPVRQQVRIGPGQRQAGDPALLHGNQADPPRRAAQQRVGLHVELRIGKRLIAEFAGRMVLFEQAAHRLAVAAMPWRRDRSWPLL